MFGSEITRIENRHGAGGMTWNYLQGEIEGNFPTAQGWHRNANPLLGAAYVTSAGFVIFGDAEVVNLVRQYNHDLFPRAVQEAPQCLTGGMRVHDDGRFLRTYRYVGGSGARMAYPLEWTEELRKFGESGPFGDIYVPWFGTRRGDWGCLDISIGK